MKKWETKTCRNRFASIEAFNEFACNMGGLGWELVSVGLDPFPPQKPEVGAQPNPDLEGEGVLMISVFKKEIPAEI